MKLKELISNLYELQDIAVISWNGKTLYKGLAKDIYTLTNSSTAKISFISAFADTIVIYLY